jgi:hypothetical protein
MPGTTPVAEASGTLPGALAAATSGDSAPWLPSFLLLKANIPVYELSCLRVPYFSSIR